VILPGTGRGTAPAGRGGGGSSSDRRPGTDRARALRKTMTVPEIRLWEQVRASRLGFKVRRQHPDGPYIADFYVRAARLIVEIDGEVHNRGAAPQRDAVRDQFFHLNGYRVLHVAASDVMNNLQGVIEAIHGAAETPLHHAVHGPPPRTGEDRL
jgi:very-short-patch-repair endonuclease